VIKEFGRGTDKKEAVLTGNISNSDMKFVKATQKKKSLLMDLLNLSSWYEPYIF